MTDRDAVDPGFAGVGVGGEARQEVPGVVHGTGCGSSCRRSESAGVVRAAGFGGVELAVFRPGALNLE